MNTRSSTQWLCLMLCLATVAFSTGCSTPLADTKYNRLSDESLTGEWRLSSQGEDDPESSSWIAKVALNPQPTSPSSLNQKLIEILQLKDESKQATLYRVTLFDEKRDETDQQMTELDGFVIEANNKLFFTFQQSVNENHPPLGPLETPLQYIVRLERNDNQLTLLTHPHTLVWCPTSFAGDFKIDRSKLDERSGPFLVQSIDDAIDYYLSTPETEWRISASARKVAARK